MMAKSKFSTLDTNLLDLDIAWQDRLEDARALLKAGRHASAIANSLYAIEILLKTKICKKLDLTKLPAAFEIHDLDGLLILAGLDRLLNHQITINPVKWNWDNILAASSRINDLRYMPDSNWSFSDAEKLLGELEDLPDGVIPWLLTQP